jgi:hypothetical protein
METAPGTHWIGGWLSLIAGLDDMEKRKIIVVTTERPPLFGEVSANFCG